MINTEQNWQQLPNLTGIETHILLQKPKNIQQQILLINAHRHLINRDIILKGVNECFKYLSGSFSAFALQIQYLCFGKDRRMTLAELPQWERILNQWDRFKFQEISTQLSLLDIGTINNSNINLFDSQEVHIVFLNLVAQDLLDEIFDSNLSLSEFEQKSFEDDKNFTVLLPGMKVLEFLDYTLPKTLIHFVMTSQQLPLQLQANKQLESLYSNKELEFIVRQSPNFSILLKIFIKTTLLNIQNLHQNEQKILMDVVFRYFYLHHSEKKHRAVELFIECFNKISQSVRYAMTEEFLLFFHVCRKIGKDRFIDLLLQKSSWLREIHERTSHKRMIGYKLEGFSPLCRYNFGEEIKVDPGKSVQRYFECLQDHSILFLRVNIDENDIDIKINHKGDFIREGEVNFTPIQFQKVEKSFIQTIILPQRGIYSIQFDNSYSWIVGKTLQYDRVILTPLSFRSNSRYSFIQNFYMSKQMNSVSKSSLIEYSLNNRITTVEIIKKTGSFSFRVQRNNDNREEMQIFEYQTDSSIRFLEKLLELNKTQTIYSFHFNGKRIKNLEEIESLINEIAPSNSQKPKKKKQVLIQIPLQY